MLRLKTESEELLFMPTINKKSKLIGRSKVAMSIAVGEMPHKQTLSARMKTPVKLPPKFE